METKKWKSRFCLEKEDWGSISELGRRTGLSWRDLFQIGQLPSRSTEDSTCVAAKMERKSQSLTSSQLISLEEQESSKRWAIKEVQSRWVVLVLSWSHWEDGTKAIWMFVKNTKFVSISGWVFLLSEQRGSGLGAWCSNLGEHFVSVEAKDLRKISTRLRVFRSTSKTSGRRCLTIREYPHPTKWQQCTSRTRLWYLEELLILHTSRWH